MKLKRIEKERIGKKRKFSEFQSPFSQPPKNVAH